MTESHKPKQTANEVSRTGGHPATQAGEPLLRGLVAQVLNERELVINIGKQDGAKVDMHFAVLAEDGLPVTDPNTGETLGILEREKVRVRVAEVLDRMAVCRTYKTYTTGSYLSGTSLFSTFGPMKVHYETLSSTKESVPAPLSPDDSYVQIGDPVKQVEEDEKD